MRCFRAGQRIEKDKFNMAGFDEAHKKEMREKQFPKKTASP